MLKSLTPIYGGQARLVLFNQLASLYQFCDGDSRVRAIGYAGGVSLTLRQAKQPSRAQRLIQVGRWLCGRSLNQALTCTERAIQEAERGHDQASLAQALNLLGTIEMDLNLISSATVSFRRAREVALRTHNIEVQLKVANNLALLHLNSGNTQQAALQFQLVQTMLADPTCEMAPVIAGLLRVNQAAIYNRWGDAHRVLHLLDTYSSTELNLPEVKVYAELARAGAHMELAQQAQQLHRESDVQRHLQAMQVALDDSLLGADPYADFVVLAERTHLQAKKLHLQGKTSEAVALLRTGLAEIQSDYAEGSIQLHLTLGKILRASDLAAAQQELQAALQLIEESGAHAEHTELLEELAKVAEQQGDYSRALGFMQQLVAELRNQQMAAAQPDLSVPPSDIEAGSSEHWQDRLRIAERQARTDALTGLNNRHAIEETLPGYIQRLTLPRHSLHVLLIDIDHFKQVNDQFSHGVGDQVLMHIAALLKAVAGAEAFAARYGGEELLLALSNIGASEAQRIAEQLRQRVAALTWLEGPSQVTISIGITKAVSQDTVTSLITRADEALYQAKNSGRNRSVFIFPNVRDDQSA